MDDVRAVLDAVGSEKTSVIGFWEGGPMATLFAATYPERTDKLILCGAHAAFRPQPDYPWAPNEEQHRQILQLIDSAWGQATFWAISHPASSTTPATIGGARAWSAWPRAQARR